MYCCKNILLFIKTMLTFRRLFILGFLACCSLLIGSHIIESFFYVIPCQLCILQRLVFYVLAILFLIGAIHNPKNIGRYAYSLLGFVFTIAGLFIAGRQVWIQHLPLDQIPECAPGLERLLALHPFLEAIKIVFKGTSECFKVHFTVLGLPLSNWGFISFTGLACMCLFIIYGQKKRWM